MNVSAASIWEIAIKTSIGKLRVRGNVPVALAKSRFKELPIRFGHALSVSGLPPHHGDPFDRILIAQAREEKMTLVTADATIRRYDVDTLDPAR